MIRRAVDVVVAAVLLAASLSHVSCDRLRVSLSADAPATLVSASVRSGSDRRSVVRLTQPGFCSSVSSGDPALPCKLIYVALPPDADPESARVLSGSYSTSAVAGRYDIAPVPAAAVSREQRDWGRDKIITSGRNEKTYSANAFYPAQQVRLVSVGNLRTWKIAVIEFWPYAYNPVTGQLRQVRSREAQLTFSRKPARSAVNDAVARAMSAFVSNRSDAISWYSASSTSSLPGFAIITTQDIAEKNEALRQYAACVGSRGFNMTVATEKEWGGGTGDVAAERIRAWLKANYLKLHLQYVLLIGDPNPTTGSVPMKMLWPRRWSTSYKEAPSDLYYSDLTGNWDRDGDGYAGEEPDDFGTGGIDEIPEVYVGRIPYYGDKAQLAAILAKTSNYKCCPRTQWMRKCLLAMKRMDDSTPSYQLGEQIKTDCVTPLSADSDRVYDSGFGVSPEHASCDYDTITNDWSAGAGLVFWMSHGTYNSASGVFISARCTYLDDSKPAIVYMASCSNGQPEYADNLGYSALARGAVTTLSASRVSWYYLGETDFRCTDSIGGLGYQYAKCLTVDMEPCGEAAADARLANPRSIWMNHLVFNLYGDPSVCYDIRRSVAAARDVADSSIAHIDTAVATRTGDGSQCWVEDPNRCAGMLITGQWSGGLKLDPGVVVTVAGLMATENGIHVLKNSQVTPISTTSALGPLAMPNRDTRIQRNLGLLVTVCGRIVASSGQTFVLSDGSLPQGLTVTCHGTFAAPTAGYVKATGIAVPDGVAVYRAEDIVLFH